MVNFMFAIYFSALDKKYDEEFQCEVAKHAALMEHVQQRRSMVFLRQQFVDL